MATQYTPILQLALPVTGELNGTWGDVVNDNITSMVEEAIAGLATINTWTANSHTLTTANGVADEARCAMLVAATGTGGTALTGVGEIICPARTKLFVLQNSSAYAVTLKTSAGTGIAVAAGDTAFLFCDGTNVNACVTQIINGHITGNLTVDGNTTLGNSTSDTITATARVASDFNPSADNTYDLGTSGNSWRNLYIDGTATIATLNVTTIDTTNLEVTNIKAKDGTAAITLADSTGVATLAANPILNAGAANGVVYLNGSKSATSSSAMTFNGTALNFGSNSQRITGDMTNATIANRLAFQSSTSNGTTAITVLPNGTGNATAIHFYTSSTDPTNSGYLIAGVYGTDYALITAGKNGTGTAVPLRTIVNGLQSMDITIGGKTAIGETVNNGNAQLQVWQGSSNYGIDLMGASSGVNSGVTSLRLLNTGNTIERLGLYGNADDSGAIRWASKLTFSDGTYSPLVLSAAYAGFGTSTPSSPIDAVTITAVGAGIRIRQPSSGDAAILQFTNNGASAERGTVQANTSGTVSVTAGGSSNYLAVTPGNGVGVNTQASGATFNVGVSSDGDGIDIFKTTLVGNTGGVVRFSSLDNSTAQVPYARIKMNVDSGVTGAQSGSLFLNPVSSNTYQTGLTVYYNGRTGINNATPTEWLDVKTDANATGLGLYYPSSAGGSGGGVVFYANNSSANKSSIARIYAGLSNGAVGNQSGNLYLQAVSGASYTDGITVAGTGDVQCAKTLQAVHQTAANFAIRAVADSTNSAAAFQFTNNAGTSDWAYLRTNSASSSVWYNSGGANGVPSNCQFAINGGPLGIRDLTGGGAEASDWPVGSLGIWSYDNFTANTMQTFLLRDDANYTTAQELWNIRLYHGAGDVTTSSSTALALGGPGNLYLLSKGSTGITFSTGSGPTERAQFTSAGQLNFNSGYGITFNGGTSFSSYEVGTYTPSITTSIGSLTTYSTTATYVKIGHVCVVQFKLSITTAGTAAGGVFGFTVPFISVTSGINTGCPTGRENAVTGLACNGYISSNSGNCTVWRYDNNSSVQDGYEWLITLTYQTAS